MDWMRSWRAIFRLLWLLRTDTNLMLAMWGLARWRIQRVLAGRWSPNPAINTDIVGPAGGPATYGEILTSEAAIAALMRFHINRPDRLFPPGTVETTVQDAIRDAALAAGVALPTPAAALSADPAFAAAVVPELTGPARDPTGTVAALRAVNAVVPDLGRRVNIAAGSFQFWAVGI
jgi:hypothetical protein